MFAGSLNGDIAVEFRPDSREEPVAINNKKEEEKEDDKSKEKPKTVSAASYVSSIPSIFCLSVHPVILSILYILFNLFFCLIFILSIILFCSFTYSL